jgi:cytochrome c oxidase assembly factor CtaG
MGEQAGSVATAQALYSRYVTATGFTPPETLSELLLFVELSGGIAMCCGDAPANFEGIQIGRWIYVRHPDAEHGHSRMRVLAHEWCHWLRRLEHGDQIARAYRGTNERSEEECIARAFERLF